MRTRLMFIALVCAAIPAACAAPDASAGWAMVQAEARQFMADYALELRERDAEPVAARFSRRGAYQQRQGLSWFESHEEIVRRYRERPPFTLFEWGDLSYEVLGENAVAVVGTYTWQSSEPGVTGRNGFAGVYTALLVREDGELRIRLEALSHDDLPGFACSPADAPCALPLDGAARSRYVGEYEVDGFGRLRVQEDGQGLVYSLPDGRASRLLYQGGDEFRLAVAPGVRVLFGRAGERASSLITFQGVVFGAGKGRVTPFDTLEAAAMLLRCSRANAAFLSPERRR